MIDIHSPLLDSDEVFVERSLHLVPGTQPSLDEDDLSSVIRPFLVRNRIEVKDVVPYCERILSDWKGLKDHLPLQKTHILDIGCGWGGHDVYLGSFYRDAKFILVEGTKTIPKVHTGFRENSQPYRNGNIAVRLLGSRNVKARLYQAGETTTNMTLEKVDLVVSFCAWGHHFPIHTYLPLVQRSLIPGGHVLVDIRTHTNGQEQLQIAGFEPTVVVKEKPKFTRVLFQKKHI